MSTQIYAYFDCDGCWRDNPPAWDFIATAVGAMQSIESVQSRVLRSITHEFISAILYQDKRFRLIASFNVLQCVLPLKVEDFRGPLCIPESKKMIFHSIFLSSDRKQDFYHAFVA